jgi:hypothetical protein
MKKIVPLFIAVAIFASCTKTAKVTAPTTKQQDFTVSIAPTAGSSLGAIDYVDQSGTSGIWPDPSKFPIVPGGVTDTFSLSNGFAEVGNISLSTEGQFRMGFIAETAGNVLSVTDANGVTQTHAFTADTILPSGQSDYIFISNVAVVGINTVSIRITTN